MSRNRCARTIVIAAALLVSFTTSLPDASASSGTATITAGSLAFISSPASIAFTATLAGADQFVTATQAFDVGDGTGTASGWNITATSTTFTAGAKTLSNTGTTVQAAPSVACDASVTCTVATTNVTYPYTLPAATTAPTATKLYNATANTGMGNQTITATVRLSVPAATLAGTYTSTWTYSLVSGP